MQVKEENGNYICLKHNRIILLVVMDNRVLPENQMLCNICMSENRLPLNQVVSVQQAEEMVKEKLIKQTEGIEQRINKQLEKLTLLQQKMIELRTQLLKNIDMINRMIDQWTHDLSKSINKKNIDLIKGLQLLQSNEGDLKQNNINQMNKIDSAFKRLQNIDGINKCYQYFRNIGSNEEQQINQLVSINYQLIGQVKQDQECNAIAFNNTGSIMVAGSDTNIKVYQFEKGKITLLTELQGQGNKISCLLFSKMNQWFISADGKWFSDCSLKCWKQGKNNREWLCNQGEKKHASYIRCIILTNDESQLISCSNDRQIMVWGVKYETNRIDYQYTLQNKHTQDVYGLSLNLSETSLVSCGQDKYLILWNKGQNGRWAYQNSITLSNSIQRVCFIGQTQLLVQQDGKRFTNVFEVVNQQFKEQIDLQITLKNHKEESDQDYFPIIYNKNKEIIILKSHQYVYIIRKQSNGSLKVESQPIDCETTQNYGNLSEDGLYLSIWNYKTEELKVYQINYE